MRRAFVQDRAKESFWRRMIRRQAGSGLSVRVWCLKHDLREWEFYRWRSRLPGEGQSTFVPVKLKGTQATVIDGHHDAHLGLGVLEVILVDGRRVRMGGRVDRQALADVLTVLRSQNQSAEPQSC